eukprot:3096525-Alexandrium_andersonii.AAC.1
MISLSEDDPLAPATSSTLRTQLLGERTRAPRTLELEFKCSTGLLDVAEEVEQGLGRGPSNAMTHG